MIATASLIGAVSDSHKVYCLVRDGLPTTMLNLCQEMRRYDQTKTANHGVKMRVSFIWLQILIVIFIWLKCYKIPGIGKGR